MLLGLAACLLAGLGAACSGERVGETAMSVEQDAPPAPPRMGTADPGPGRVLLRFVRAAGAGDARTMWELLSTPTQASFGPTFAIFRRGAASEFREGVGALASDGRVTLSHTLPGGRAVAAVAGERMAEGEREHFAYGAALVRERGGLRLELGGLAFSDHRPEPNHEIGESQASLSVKVSAGDDVVEVRAWLDGKPVPATRGTDDPPFTATVRARPAETLAPGLHEAVVFAATERTAAASAWSFVVE